MNDLLKVILKKEKALTVIQNQVIEDRLVFRLIDFVDNDGNFKSLFVCYNLDCIFSEKLKLIGKINSQSLTDRIRASIKVFRDKDDYLEYKWKLNSEYISKILDGFELEISDRIFDIKVDSFRIRKVTVSWFPVITIIVNYNYKGLRQEPLIVFPGRVNFVEHCKKNFLDFKIKIIELLTEYVIGGDSYGHAREIN